MVLVLIFFKKMNVKQASERVMLSIVILRRETFLQVGLGKPFWTYSF